MVADNTSTTEQLGFTYVIRVEGVLDRHWAEWFGGLTVTAADGETTPSGPARDLAELHGLLIKVRDLGLPLLEVRRIAEPCSAGGKGRGGQEGR